MNKKEITLKEYINYLSTYANDFDKPIKGMGYNSDGFYTIHVDDGYVQKIIKIPGYKE